MKKATTIKPAKMSQPTKSIPIWYLNGESGTAVKETKPRVIAQTVVNFWRTEPTADILADGCWYIVISKGKFGIWWINTASFIIRYTAIPNK